MRFLFAFAFLFLATVGHTAEGFADTWIAPASKEYSEFRLVLKKDGSGRSTENDSTIDAKWSATEGGIMLSVLGVPRKLKYNPVNDTLSEANINMVYLRAAAARAAKPPLDIDPRLVGSWSNKSGDKSKLALLLFKKDGNGILSTGGLDLNFRWSRSDGGIRVYFSGSGSELNYDPAKDTLLDPSSEMAIQVYWRISARTRSSQKKAVEAAANSDESAEPQPKTTTQEYVSSEQLREAITQKLDASGSSLSFISIGRPAREFTVRKLARSCFIELYLVTKSVEKPTPNARQTQVELSADPALPVRYSVPADRADALGIPPPCGHGRA